MEMQVYAMDACLQIGQGGRKESDGSKGWNNGYICWLSVWVIGFRNECLNHIQTWIHKLWLRVETNSRNWIIEQVTLEMN